MNNGTEFSRRILSSEHENFVVHNQGRVLRQSHDHRLTNDPLVQLRIVDLGVNKENRGCGLGVKVVCFCVWRVELVKLPSDDKKTIYMAV